MDFGDGLNGRLEHRSGLGNVTVIITFSWLDREL